MKRTYRKLLLLGIVCSTLFVLISSGCEKKQEISKIVASVGKEKLTYDDLRRTFKTEQPQSVSAAQIQNYVQRWIDSQLIYQEALRQKFQQVPFVKKRIDEVYRELLVAIFLDVQVNQKIEVNEPEIEAYYNAHREDFPRPLETRHVWITLVKNRSHANSVRRQILNGADLETVAKAESIDLSAGNGGDMGFVRKDQLVKELGDAVFKLSAGRLSLPIRSDLGYYIAKVIEIRKAGEVQVLEEVYNQIKERLVVSKRMDEYDHLLATLKETANVEKNFGLISELIISNPDTTFNRNNDSTMVQ